MYWQNTVDQAVTAISFLLMAVTAIAHWIASWDWTAIGIAVVVLLGLHDLNAIRENTRKMLRIMEQRR